MIKGVKPSGRFTSGEYNPANKEKYVGTYPIIFRSSWEKKMCFYLDNDPKVIKWASEPFEIPYISRVDRKRHRYYPDFYFMVLRGDECLEYVAEVKPNQQLNRPNKPKTTNIVTQQKFNYQLKNYLTVVSKMEAAKEWCAARKYRYIFIDEVHWHKFFK